MVFQMVLVFLGSMIFCFFDLFLIFFHFSGFSIFQGKFL